MLLVKTVKHRWDAHSGGSLERISFLCEELHSRNTLKCLTKFNAFIQKLPHERCAESTWHQTKLFWSCLKEIYECLAGCAQKTGIRFSRLNPFHLENILGPLT